MLKLQDTIIYYNMSGKAKQRRTLIERAEDIFDFIERQNNVFPKSRLKEIGLNPKTAEKWLKLIDYIQSKPKIRLIQSEHNTLIEKVEGNYQALMRKMIIDDSIPFEQRLQQVTDYLKSLYARERLNKSGFDHYKKIPSISNKNKIRDFSEFKEALHIFKELDSCFEEYIEFLSKIDNIKNESEKLYEISKRKRQLVLSRRFKLDVERLLQGDSIENIISEIEKKDPVYRSKFELAKKTILDLFDLYYAI